MTEEEIEGVVDGVAQPAESEQEEAQAPQQSRRTDAEYNWAEMRRRTEQLERRTREQEELIEKMRTPQVQEEDFSNLDDDDLLTVKQHKALSRKIATQVAADLLKQREASSSEERVRQKYPDFDEVVTDSAIELLEKNDPELTLSMRRLSDDPYAQSVAVYKLLKKMDYAPRKVNTIEKKKALENSQKPLSINSASKQSAIGNINNFENGITQGEKDRLWEEMKRAANS
jgi:hypothetical protein